MLVSSGSALLPRNNFDPPPETEAAAAQKRLAEILRLGVTARSVYRCSAAPAAFASLPVAVQGSVQSGQAAVTSGAVNQSGALLPAVDALGQAGAGAVDTEGPEVVPMTSTPGAAGSSVPSDYNPPGYAGLELPAGTSSGDFSRGLDSGGDYEPGEMSPGTPLSRAAGPRRRAFVSTPKADRCAASDASGSKIPGVPWGEAALQRPARPAAAGGASARSAVLVSLGLLFAAAVMRK